jgi:putative addiction module CopG family antidote
MRSTQPITVTLPVELAQMVKAKVASGEYATEGDVIRDGLRSLAEHDRTIEQWLRDEVLPTLEDLDRNPTKAKPLAEVRKRLQAHIDTLTAGPDAEG